MSDGADTEWNEATDIQCLIIFKRLFVEDFPRGRQIEYCRELSSQVGINADRLSGRVSDYKSAAGLNQSSDASVNTIRLYKKHRHTSIRELERMLSRLLRR